MTSFIVQAYAIDHSYWGVIPEAKLEKIYESTGLVELYNGDITSLVRHEIEAGDIPFGSLFILKIPDDNVFIIGRVGLDTLVPVSGFSEAELLSRI